MKTQVLIVDDSPLIRAVLREAFERTSDLAVAGEAADGAEAVDKVRALRPDIVTMDVAMPKMDGLTATREIMRLRPTPILIVARDGGDAGALAMAALGHGALGIFSKPSKGFDGEASLALADSIRKLVRESQTAATRAAAETSKIRLLIVDDSLLARQSLRSMVADASDIEVVGEAGDGVTAVAMAREIEPDVVTLDLFMPMMDGGETAEKLSRLCDPGILVVTQEIEGAGHLLQDRPSLGAIELFSKSRASLGRGGATEMVQAVRRLAERVRRQRRMRRMARPPALERPDKAAVVGIVGSTGAPRVLRDLLMGLSADFPLPIAMVQHTERGLANTLVAWLRSLAPMPVVLGESGHVLAPGEIVVAPDALHMEISTGGAVHLKAGDPVDGFRPSGTVLLASLARSFGAHAAGLVLSGMGTDGAQGLAAISAAGGYAIIEDPETAVVPGMPKRALGLAGGAMVERASGLVSLLGDLAGSRRR
jgi:two-component system, chemotaxis family, protein-glutamate methylesterase/glutaminase